MDASSGIDVEALVYPNERRLFAISVVLGLVGWLAIIVGTLGLALLWLALGFTAYLFAQSALISRLRGNGVRITAEQFPDLHARLLQCCVRVGIDEPPESYLIHADGAFNAFATRFLGRNFVVLFSDVVDALDADPEAVNFYIGHELGHIRRKHLQWAPLLWPAGLLPLFGAAYSRAREYTCDAYGAACSANTEAVAHGLAALAAGHGRWRRLSVEAFRGQERESGGFWMSFHELIGDYPWLAKRMARATFPHYQPLGRHPLAWLLASFVPRMGVGGGSSMLVTVAMIGVLAAVAIPAYQDFTVRAKVAEGLALATAVKSAVAEHYAQTHEACESNEACGLPAPEEIAGAAVGRVEVGSGARITIEFTLPATDHGTIVFVPRAQPDGTLRWACTDGTLAPKEALNKFRASGGTGMCRRERWRKPLFT
ncbi:MAG: M48 family metalloprotease [Gammaproteobacteria bacterium]|nr:M48 family metalloprotease [Gammaproteobacteria bacterium]